MDDRLLALTNDGGTGRVDVAETAIGNKADKDLGNITDDGKTAIRSLIKLEQGENVTVTKTTSGGVDTYKISATGGGSTYTAGDGIAIAADKVSVNAGDGLAFDSSGKLQVNKDGAVASGDTGIVTGGAVYTAIQDETRVAADGNYIEAANSAAKNLTALDNQVKINADDIATLKTASADVLAAIGTVDEDKNYIRKSATNNVSENLIVLDDQVKKNADNIATNAADIATNKADIATNKADIATNKADIATNKADIATNKADIATNKADIATNKADIATNKADIAINKADIAANKADIAANKADIAANKADIDKINAQDGIIAPSSEAKAKEFVKGYRVYDYLHGDTLALGKDSEATGTNSLAIGFGNKVSGNSSGAFGDPNDVSGNGSYAIGNDNTVSGDNTFVLGSKVNTGAKNAVVLGDGSEGVDDAVSVGSSDNKRQIKNVADGTDDSDAATVGQLKAMAGGGADLGPVNHRISKLDSKVNKAGAGAAALAALHPLEMDNKFGVGLGYGNYHNANAMALGLFYRPTDRVMFSIGGSMGNGENMVNAGISIALDKGVTTSKAAMAKKIQAQDEKIAAQDAEIAALKEALARLEAKVGK